MGNFVFPTQNTGANPVVSLTASLLCSDGTNTGSASVSQVLSFLSSPLIVNGNIVTSGSTYSCSNTDYLVIINKVTASATGVTLPTSPATWRVVVIKDGAGNAASYNITISAASGNIDGAAHVVLNNNYASVELVYNGSQWNII